MTPTTTTCACRLITIEHIEEEQKVIDADIDYCPLHAAAEELAQALESVLERLDGGFWFSNDSVVPDAARAALRKAGRAP